MNDITYPPGCKDIQVELTNDELIRRLKKIQQSFQDLKQDSTEKYKELALYLGSDVFLEHEHDDVKLLVACCIADVFRIYAPDSPYQDPSNLKKIFLFLANQLKGLKENSNPSFKRYHYLLENLESVNTFLLCLELEDSQDIIADVFETVFKIINDKTTPKVKTLLFDLLHPLLNESDQLSSRVLDTLFARIIEPQKSNNKEAYNLAVNLIKKGNEHFEFLVQNHLNNILLTSRNNLSLTNHHHTSNTSLNTSLSSDDSFTFNNDKQASSSVHGTSNQFISDKLCLIIYELNNIRYALLELLLPQLEYKLKSNDLKERREYTKLLSKMFSERDSSLAQKIPSLWDAYLERFADANEDIRKICIQHIYDFLLQQSNSIKSIGSTSQSTSSSSTINLGSTATGNLSNSVILDQIIEIIKNRSLDSEEALRLEVVQEILKAIKQDSNLITIELLNVLKDRTLDVKIKVRKAALQGLAALYKKIHSKTNTSRQTVQVINWIPTKIMRIYFQESIEDKLLVERLLNSSIVPYSLSAKEKMAQLYYAFTTFDEYSILSLIEIMKNRVFLNQTMKSIIDVIETNVNSKLSEANEKKLNNDIVLVSQHLLDATKGHEFMKSFVNFLKTNHNVRTYFKNLVNVNSSCSKSMQFIQLILTNLNSLNQTQTGMAKRLIERMSSIIIDKECLESLIELVDYKVKQKLTLKQRKLLNKRKKKAEVVVQTKSKSTRSTKSKKTRSKSKDSDESDYDDNNDDFDDDEEEDDEDLNEEDETMDSLEIPEDDEDDAATKTTENSKDDIDDRLLVRHIDDDGEKGIKLLNFILLIHSSYGFNNSSTYRKLFTFVNSRKDNVVSSILKLLGNYFSLNMRSNFVKEETDLFNKTNNDYLEKLKNLCKYGKPKQAKHSVHLIFNNFEKPKNEEILYDLYKELTTEAEQKQSKTFITCLISLSHICYFIPKLVGKEIKEFISKSIVKDILMQPSTTQLNISLNESSSSLAAKRKNNLKLAGKWCENEDELPFGTRTRIEAIKLVIRWCLGLKSECTNILFTLKILVKLLKENSSDTLGQRFHAHGDDSTEDSKTKTTISEAEKSRIRAVCGSQILKLAQEPCFKQLITAEYFHVLAKLIIDPVNNVRDIIIKKLHKGLKSNKLSSYYASIFALSGLDSNKDRKLKVKKIFMTLIKQYRQTDPKDMKTRILPEMCLSYSVSLLAHNVKIDSLKDDHKVKQIKECMFIILDPLLENPDGYQIALIKKILNKIKISDDGLAASAVSQSSQSDNQTLNKNSLQNLYMYNKSLVFICEIFLFHMHSKSSSYLTAKECQFDVKLPSGFYAAQENGSTNNEQQQQLSKELEEHFKKSTNENTNKPAEEISDNQSEKSEASSNIEISKETQKTKTTISRIEIIPLNRKRKANDQNENKQEKENTNKSTSNNNSNNSVSEVDSDDENIVLSDLIKAQKNKNNSLKDSNDQSKNSNSIDTSNMSRASSPPANKKRLTDTNLNEETSKGEKNKINRSEEISIEDNEKEEVKTVGRRSARNLVTTPPKSTETKSKETTAKKNKRYAKKSNDTDLEEEKENEKESDEEIVVEKKTKANKKMLRVKSKKKKKESKEDKNEPEVEDVEIQEEEEEDDEEEEEEKSEKQTRKPTRTSARSNKKQNDTKQTSSKKEETTKSTTANSKKDLSKTVTESPSYSLRQKRAATSTSKK